MLVKNVKQFFNQEVYRRLIEEFNHANLPNFEETEFTSFGLLLDSFSWDESIYDVDYWNEIYDNYDEKYFKYGDYESGRFFDLSVPDFPKEYVTDTVLKKLHPDKTSKIIALYKGNNLTYNKEQIESVYKTDGSKTSDFILFIPSYDETLKGKKINILHYKGFRVLYILD